ncbi:hypothetical protein D3C87_1382340 [compost metagenome]
MAPASGVISKARARPPSTLTSATPGRPLSAGRTVQSRRERRSSRDRFGPSRVNMKTSDSGVEIGDRPPVTMGGRSAKAAPSLSAACWRAQ